MLTIPPEYAENLVTSTGDAGRAWLATLPDLLAARLEEWSLTPDGPLRHGFMGIVAFVHQPDGTEAVLKITWLDDETRWEPHTLAAWNGHGAVRLLARDDPNGVLLLERLNPNHTVRELDGESAAAIAGQMCRRLAVPAPSAIPKVRDLAERWTTELPATWERLGRPLPKSTLDAAIATCHELGPDQPDLLLHGDLTFDSILRADREPWLVIDPYGLAGEPAFDAAKLLTNRWSELTAQPNLKTAVHCRLSAFTEGAEVDFDRAPPLVPRPRRERRAVVSAAPARGGAGHRRALRAAERSQMIAGSHGRPGRRN
jgi:streptomycin 6-kinase